MMVLMPQRLLTLIILAIPGIYSVDNPSLAVLLLTAMVVGIAHKALVKIF